MRDPEGVSDRVAGDVKSAFDFAVDRKSAQRVGVLVLGMHRAGTSALTRMLNLLGCALPRTMLGGDEANPGGHWESDRMWRFNDELLASAGSKWDDWLPIGDEFYTAPGYPDLVARGAELLRGEFGTAPLFVFKDPRNCRLARFWMDVFADQAISLAVVIPIRNPLEVARSLNRRNKADEQYGTLLWLRHVLDAEMASRGRTRVFTSYDQMIDCWEVVASQLQQGLGMAWPRMSPIAQEEIAAFIDKRQRHELVARGSIDDNPMISNWLQRTWAILDGWAINGEDAKNYAELDAILQSFNDAIPAFARLILRGTQAQGRIDELERTLAELRVENAVIAEQGIQQLNDQHEALALQLSEASDRLAENVSLVAERDSALLQRREENQQAWVALSQEQTTSALLRSQIVDIAKREELQQQRLGEAREWVFRLAGERLAAERQAERLAKAQARFTQDAKIGAVRREELARMQAQLQERTGEVASLSQLLQEAGSRAILAETVVQNSQPVASNDQINEQHDLLLNERAIAENQRAIVKNQLRERFGEVATLTTMVRDQEAAAGRQNEHGEWLRQVSAALITRPRWWALMPMAWQRHRDGRRLKLRGLFDAAAYWAAHPDVSKSGMDPLRHYMLHGYAEGRLPTSARLLRAEAGQ